MDDDREREGRGWKGHQSEKQRHPREHMHCTEVEASTRMRVLGGEGRAGSVSTRLSCRGKYGGGWG
jgi:hypothetical protein